MSDDPMFGYTRDQLESLYAIPEDDSEYERSIIPALAHFELAHHEYLGDAAEISDGLPGYNFAGFPAQKRRSKAGGDLAPALLRAGAFTVDEKEFKALCYFAPPEHDSREGGPFSLFMLMGDSDSDNVTVTEAGYKTVAALAASGRLLPASKYARDGSPLDA